MKNRDQLQQNLIQHLVDGIDLETLISIYEDLTYEYLSKLSDADFINELKFYDIKYEEEL